MGAHADPALALLSLAVAVQDLSALQVQQPLPPPHPPPTQYPPPSLLPLLPYPGGLVVEGDECTLHDPLTRFSAAAAILRTAAMHAIDGHRSEAMKHRAFSTGVCLQPMSMCRSTYHVRFQHRSRSIQSKVPRDIPMSTAVPSCVGCVAVPVLQWGS